MRLLLVLLWLVPASALADARVAFLTRQLQQAKDPRLRAQAALMLGGAQDGSVPQALCTALKDDSSIVRASVARALARQGSPVGAACMRRHLPDPDPTVQAELETALGMTGPKRAVTPEFYVALSSSAQLRGAEGDSLARMTLDELRERLRGMGGVLAPEHEDRAHALAQMRSGGLKGYALRAVISAAPSGGLKLSVTCFTYPDHALLGEVNVNARGAKPPDLLRALVPKALEETSQTCNWSN